jgi:hypothetical protein
MLILSDMGISLVRVLLCWRGIILLSGKHFKRMGRMPEKASEKYLDWKF